MIHEDNTQQQEVGDSGGPLISEVSEEVESFPIEPSTDAPTNFPVSISSHITKNYEKIQTDSKYEMFEKISKSPVRKHNNDFLRS